jgi:hypothetical protein
MRSRFVIATTESETFSRVSLDLSVGNFTVNMYCTATGVCRVAVPALVRALGPTLCRAISILFFPHDEKTTSIEIIDTTSY